MSNKVISQALQRSKRLRGKLTGKAAGDIIKSDVSFD
jgi:hypothetical protein